jgi:hypothetical protein
MPYPPQLEGSELNAFLSWQVPAAQLPIPPSGSKHCSPIEALEHSCATQLSPSQTKPSPQGTPPVDEAPPEPAVLDDKPETAPVLPPVPAEVPPFDRPPEPALPPVVLEVEPRFPPHPARKQTRKICEFFIWSPG